MSDHATELDKLKEAARLIEVMTGNRFKGDQHNSFIHSESDQFIAVHMRKDSIEDGEEYHVRFEAELMESGKPLNTEQLLRLVYEGGVAYALMNKLAETEYHPTQQDLVDFNEHILRQEEEIQSEGFSMNQEM